MNDDSLVPVVLLIGSVVFFGGAAVIALAWAMNRKELGNFQRGATSIFDADEPVGQVTETTLDPRRKGQP